MFPWTVKAGMKDRGQPSCAWISAWAIPWCRTTAGHRQSRGGFGRRATASAAALQLRLPAGAASSSAPSSQALAFSSLQWRIWPTTQLLNYIKACWQTPPHTHLKQWSSREGTAFSSLPTIPLPAGFTPEIKKSVKIITRSSSLTDTWIGPSGISSIEKTFLVGIGANGHKCLTYNHDQQNSICMSAIFQVILLLGTDPLNPLDTLGRERPVEL